MKPEDIDKIFRESANSAQFEFDPEEWKKAKAMLPNKKRRRWFPLFLLLIGAGTFVSLALLNNSPEEKDIYQENTLFTANQEQTPADDAPIKNQNQQKQIGSAQKSDDYSINENKNVRSSDAVNTKQPYTSNNAIDNSVKSISLLTSSTSTLAARNVISIPRVGLNLSQIQWRPFIDRPARMAQNEISDYRKWEFGLALSAVANHLQGGSTVMALPWVYPFKKTFAMPSI